MSTMAKISQQGSLLDLAPREIADTSLEGYRRHLKTIRDDELAVYQALWHYSRVNGVSDMTGRELADAMRWDVLNVRPRLTGLLAKGYVLKGTIRNSRVSGEARCRGYRPVVPLSAVERK